MSLPQRLRKFAGEALDLGILFVSDVIDSWSTGESRAALLDRLRKATERGGELALEVARLEEEADRLRFNGPTLWREEVELLKDIAERLRTSMAEYKLFDETLAMLGRNLQIIQALLDRCDHMPMTSEEFGKMADDAITGKVKTFDWNDIGKDVDGPELGELDTSDIPF